MEDELRAAIEKKQLKLVYQPIFYLPTETLAGFEAQLNWEHPRLGLLNPTHFVPVAEESDLIIKLGSYVLQRAVREAQRWQRELPRPDQPLFVSVNVSSRQLFRPELINEVRHILGRAVLPKGSLRLEITEALAMENPEKAASVLEQLAAAGAGLSLDDFATGYSSFSYLTQFSFDTVKVDRAFVQVRGLNGTGAVVLRAVIALAHELGKKVVAEGVETEDDVGFLRSIGCEYAQGHYYGDGMAERDVLQLLRVVRRAERRLRKSSLFRQRLRARQEPAAPGPASMPEAPPRRAPPQPAPPVNGAGGPPPPPRVQAPPSPPPGAAAPPNGVHPPRPPPLPRQGQPPMPPGPEPRPGTMQPNLQPAPSRPAPAAPPAGGGAVPRPPPLPNGARKGGMPPPPPGDPRLAPPPIQRGGPPPRPPHPVGGRPPPDFSRLPPSIRASLAKLAGETGEDEQPPPDPPAPAKPGAS
jgi:EAL domain-containing protein (putative c-di-GMP-specific phosphodiesterase class I)